MHAHSHLRSVPRDTRPPSDALDETVLVLDSEGRIISAAGALESIFGAASQDLVGCGLKDLLALAATSAPRDRRASDRIAAANDNRQRPMLRRVA